ncbi:MAG: Spo0E family sporulation regulatory protein-aspartic acid phosphatase [Peptococcaceae bacterium]
MSDHVLKALECQIEMIRAKLENLVTEKGVTNEEVLECSRELDKLIVTYQRIVMLKK